MGKSGASYIICIIILDTIFHWKRRTTCIYIFDIIVIKSYNVGIKQGIYGLSQIVRRLFVSQSCWKKCWAKNIWLISIEIYLQYNIGIKCFLVLWYYFLLCTYTHIIKCISPPHPYNINTDISSVIKHGLIRAFYYACLYLIYVFIIHQYLVSWAAI